MLDFNPLKNKEISFHKMASHLTIEEYKNTTRELIDYVLSRIADIDDAAVTFLPVDPAANDPYAENPEDVNLAWTLAHVIVHLTASLEESAFMAAELARGVAEHGRSRYETPWQSVTTVQGCRERLEESLHMCLASLEMWPDPPHYENTYIPWESLGEIDARGRYLLGLKHADDHLGQINDILKQINTAA